MDTFVHLTHAFIQISPTSSVNEEFVAFSFLFFVEELTGSTNIDGIAHESMIRFLISTFRTWLHWPLFNMTLLQFKLNSKIYLLSRIVIIMACIQALNSGWSLKIKNENHGFKRAREKHTTFAETEEIHYESPENTLFLFNKMPLLLVIG